MFLGWNYEGNPFSKCKKVSLPLINNIVVLTILYYEKNQVQNRKKHQTVVQPKTIVISLTYKMWILYPTRKFIDTTRQWDRVPTFWQCTENSWFAIKLPSNLFNLGSDQNKELIDSVVVCCLEKLKARPFQWSSQGINSYKSLKKYNKIYSVISQDTNSLVSNQNESPLNQVHKTVVRYPQLK